MTDASDRATVRTRSEGKPCLVLNRPAALKRMDGDESLLDSYLDSFVKGMGARLADVIRAIETGNAEELELAAHSLKGGAAMAGAERVVQVALRLELMGRTGDASGAAAALDELAVEVSDVLARISRPDSV